MSLKDKINFLLDIIDASPYVGYTDEGDKIREWIIDHRSILHSKKIKKLIESTYDKVIVSKRFSHEDKKSFVDKLGYLFQKKYQKKCRDKGYVNLKGIRQPIYVRTYDNFNSGCVLNREDGVRERVCSRKGMNLGSNGRCRRRPCSDGYTRDRKSKKCRRKRRSGRKKSKKSRSGRKKSKKSRSSRKKCKKSQTRNKSTGRCRKKCKKSQKRSKSTGRCIKRSRKKSKRSKRSRRSRR